MQVGHCMRSVYTVPFILGHLAWPHTHCELTSYLPSCVKARLRPSARAERRLLYISNDVLYRPGLLMNYFTLVYLLTYCLDACLFHLANEKTFELTSLWNYLM